MDAPRPVAVETGTDPLAERTFPGEKVTIVASTPHDEAWTAPLEPGLGRGHLVFDEMPAARRALIEALRKVGISSTDVAVADSLEHALDCYSAEEPRIVFFEIPSQAGGIEALEEMLSRRPEAKVVLVTGESLDSPGVRRAVRAGIVAIVEKPLRVDRLRQVLLEIEQEEGGIERIR